jgi:hypothetical protein
MIHPSLYPIQVELQRLDPSGRARTFTGEPAFDSFNEPVVFNPVPWLQIDQQPVITSNVNGSTRWQYVIVPYGYDAHDWQFHGWASPVADIRTGPEVLSEDTYNEIAVPEIEGGTTCTGVVYRIAGRGNSGKIGEAFAGTIFKDVGQPADGVMPPIRG